MPSTHLCHNVNINSILHAYRGERTFFFPVVFLGKLIVRQDGQDEVYLSCVLSKIYPLHPTDGERSFQP